MSGAKTLVNLSTDRNCLITVGDIRYGGYGACRACRCFEVCLAFSTLPTGANTGALRRHHRSRRKRTKVCQLWAQAVDYRPQNCPAPPAIAYTFAESRCAREIEGQLSSFVGVLQVDGYQAYKTLIKRRRATETR